MKKVIFVLFLTVLGGSFSMIKPASALAGDPPPPGKVHVTVKDQQGNKVPGTYVEILNLAGVVRAQGTTDVTGVYLFNSIPPGDYILWVSNVGYFVNSIQILVVSGITTTVSIQMTLETE